jgi:hypothetical protein
MRLIDETLKQLPAGSVLVPVPLIGKRRGLFGSRIATRRTSLLGENTRRENRALPHQITFVSELARAAFGYARQYHRGLSPDQQELQSLLLGV